MGLGTWEVFGQLVGEPRRVSQAGDYRVTECVVEYEMVQQLGPQVCDECPAIYFFTLAKERQARCKRDEKYILASVLISVQ